jgi:hypothetical protein
MATIATVRRSSRIAVPFCAGCKTTTRLVNACSIWLILELPRAALNACTVTIITFGKCAQGSEQHDASWLAWQSCRRGKMGNAHSASGPRTETHVKANWLPGWLTAAH